MTTREIMEMCPDHLFYTTIELFEKVDVRMPRYQEGSTVPN